MAHKFVLKPSSTQSLLLCASHALLALLLWIYLEPRWFAALSVLLLLLLCLRDLQSLRGRAGELLSVDSAAGRIGLESRGQPYFYCKYKVYACRWFAILKLMDKQQPRTLILNPDRLDHPQNYRSLRISLLALEPDRAA